MQKRGGKSIHLPNYNRVVFYKLLRQIKFKLKKAATLHLVDYFILYMKIASYKFIWTDVVFALLNNSFVIKNDSR